MVAIGWYALWSCFIPVIAIMDQSYFDLFQVGNLLAFLPADTYQAALTYFEGIPTGKFIFFIAIMCLKGSAIGALSALLLAMAADVIDLDSARTGKKQGGAYFSIWGMTRKLAYAVGLFVGTSAAVIVGFNFRWPIRSILQIVQSRCFGWPVCIPLFQHCLSSWPCHCYGTTP